jgi:HAMP domain-containing protein
MKALHRVYLYVRYTTPLYPFVPFAVHESGCLREQPRRDRVEQYVDTGAGNIPIPYEGGPLWRDSHDDAVKAAIDELEAAAASIATLIDQMQQRLLQHTTNKG